MKVFTIIPIYFFMLTSVHGQSVELLKQFDAIPLGGKRFEIIGFMASHPRLGREYKTAQSTNSYNEYSFNEYTDDSIRIVLNYHKGILFDKKLVYKYPITQMNLAKIQFQQTSDYIFQPNKVAKTMKSNISNKAFGSDIGESFEFYIDLSDKNYQRKTSTYEATLKFDYNESIKKTSASIIGYEIVYECVDLSNTSLSSKNGFSTTQ
jgi:hypothetical protein